MISNASPLIFLAKINKLTLIKELFKTVTIPMAVHNEIFIKDQPDSSLINQFINNKTIKIQNPNTLLDLDIGKGEQAAISMAKERNDKLLIDDAVGIRASQSLNIKTFRTTSIILLAYKNKILNKKQAITSINNLLNHGYYISPKHYATLITKLISKDY